MQTKIKNPYKSRLPKPTTEAMQYAQDITKALAQGFNEGVIAATEQFRPKNFAEQLPEEGQPIIVFLNGMVENATFNGRYLIPRGYHATRGSYWKREEYFTHWMPLIRY